MSCRILLALYLSAGLTGCADDAARPPAPASNRLAPEAPPSFDHAIWSAPEPGSAVAARVNGAPISAALVARAAKASGLTPSEALERLVELELLAQDAVGRDLLAAGPIQWAWRNALAHHFLVHGFEADLDPSDISLKQVERIYYMPDIIKIYDHHDSWRMAHLLFTCCDAKADICDSPEAIECFETAGHEIQTVYAEIKPLADGARGDPEALMRVLKDFRADNEARWPGLAYRDLAFYYDPKKPHDQQKGYDIVVEEVARTIIEAPTAVLQPPLQSPFGWHVVAKLDHDPESRRGPDHPEVIADIRRNAFPAYRQGRFHQILAELRQRLRVQERPEALELLQRGGVASDPAGDDS